MEFQTFSTLAMDLMHVAFPQMQTKILMYVQQYVNLNLNNSQTSVRLYNALIPENNNRILAENKQTRTSEICKESRGTSQYEVSSSVNIHRKY